MTALPLDSIKIIGIDIGVTGAIAIRRWPRHAGLFARVKDDGRAESALIAIAGLQREARR